MSQSCTYTFKGPDGRKMTIEGASALKAYLATGGLEFLLGEARADLARRPEQVLASQGREGDWSRLPGTHATKAAAEATVKVKVNGAKGTKPNPAWREYEFRIGQGRDDQWYVDARKRPGAASMKLSDKISYEGVTRSANRQIDTPEFKTWSGGNPVVLAAEASKHQFETGKPVVVEGFHGTRRNFDRVDTAQASAGYFLTSKPLVADEYAGVYPEGMGGGSFPLGGNVQRQYVRMDNPLVINARGASFNRVDTRAIPGYPLQMSNTDAINQWAKSQGYDGIIYKDLRDSMSRPDGRNAPPSNVYVTFKPSFVKSAVGNSGEYSLQEESFLASRDRPGINVRSDGDNRYADLIVDGTKTMESRDSDSLRPYVGKTVGVVRTGEGPARLIGSVTVGEPTEVDATEFRAREDEHLVPEGSTFDIKPGKTKWLYPLTDAQRFEQEQPVGSRGIVSRKVRFSPDRAQIETPEFKRWFGKSKVVDSDGKPLVVYHGSDEIFTVFDMERAEDGAHFFTADSRLAANFGDTRAFFVSLQNPMIIEQADLDAAWDREHPSGEQDDRNLLPRDFVPEFVRRAKAEGRDGLVVRGMQDVDSQADVFLPLRPEQIKSATDNRGTFDPDDPDIRRSEGRQELPRGYVGPVSEEEREQGLLVKRLEDESFEAWGAGREKVTADTVRWVTERMREAGIEDPAVKEASISAVRSLSLGKIAPGGEYDPETHPYFSDYRAAAGRLQSARNALQQMISARLGPPEFEGMRQLADFDREQVRTPEFRRWFKDSKVVDGRGRPLIVFHGTNRDFSEFATVREAGAVRNNNWFGQLGSWFAAPQPDNEDYEVGNAEFTAEAFSELRGDEGSVVYPVYLSIQNPYEVEGYESLTEERDDAGGAAAFRQMLVKQGYDGVVVRDSDTDGGQIRDDWVAFYPTQIKSAIGNTGAFAADNPDITKSSGRDVRPLSIEQDSREWAVDGEPTITLNKANFGGRSGLEWVDGDNENYVTSIAAYGDARGHEMLRWLKDHTGKPSFAVSAVDDAIGFYERMGEIGLMSGYTQDTVDSFFGIDFGDGEPQRYAGDVRFNRDDARRSAERFTDDQREELERAGRDAEDAIRSAPRDYNVDLTAQQEAEKPAKAWIEKVYAGLPRNPMMPRQRVMMFGEDDFAVLELDASGLNPGGVTINWIQAYPLRSGNGTKAIRELQRMAAEDGIELDLWPWDKGRVSQANLIKFYKSVGFEPIKRGSKNMIWRPEGVSRSAERSPLGFYSALAKGIGDLPTKQAPAGAWKAAIKGLVNKGAAKADEVEWSGINDWLDLQQGKVTKEQVAEYLNQGGVRVEEVQMGGPRGLPAILSDYFENTTARQPNTTEGWIAEAARQERKAQQFQAQGNDRLAKRFFELAEAMNEYAEGGETGALATKYSQYTLPGGENYREVLLTLPGAAGAPPRPPSPESYKPRQERMRRTSEVQERLAKLRGPKLPSETEEQYDARYSGDEAAALDMELYRLLEENRAEYARMTRSLREWEEANEPRLFRSNHWDQPNVLAHIRVNDRTDADGKRVLFVEELQSDWGQEGKKKGFRRTLSAAQQKRVGELNRVTEERDFTDAEQAEYDSLRDGFSNDAGLPAAPFVTKTEGWLNLALKRVMIMAAEEGYDKVAFVNGEQSADRYDLSKQVNYIQWSPGYNANRRLVTLEMSDGKELGLTVQDGVVEDSSIGADGKPLEDVLGKEIAKKILDAESGDLRGLDLKVGGEGMKAFYDTIVPTALKKLLPKVGGGQMGNVRLPQRLTPQEQDSFFEKNGYMPDEEPLTQPGFEVTDAMREKVSEGLPLFSRDRAAWTDERIDSLLSEHAYTMDDGRSKAYAGFVSPEDYLRATTPASGVERLESEKRPLDAKQLADQVQPIFLKGGPQGDGTWKTTGHEGRHRMMALRDAGVRRVPVVFDVGYGLTREPIERLYVTPQRWSGAGQAQGGFFVDNLIPISYKHADDLREVFGGDGSAGGGSEPDAANEDIRFSVDRDYRPEKTVKAYKLFRMDERRPGELFPLFVDADRPVPMGEWLSAQAGPPAAGGKVKSKLGPLAYRPGWHAGDLPVATHIGMKKAASDGKPGLRNPEHVWAEVEMAADVDWQAEANKRGTNKDGKVVPVKAHITDEIPRRGFYRYKTNPNMTGNWLIGGEMRVLRLLPDSEVQRINRDAGVADLPRKEPLDLNRFGFESEITKSADRDDRATSAWQSPSASKFDDWVYKLQDKQIDTKRVVDEIKDVAGALADDLDVYLQEELFHGRAAKRTEDFVNKELRPLVDSMAKDGLKIEDLDTFLHARHAREANAVIAQRNPEIQDGGSGMTNQDAADYFANLDEAQRRKLEAAAAKVDAILAETRKMMVDYQLESPDVIKGWGQMFQHYVPLMREDEGAGAGVGIGQGFSIKGREVKSRTGSTRKVVDIFANIAMQRERTIVRGEKNRVSQALHGLAAASPNKEFWTVDKVPTTPTFNPATGLVEDRPDTLFKMRDNVIVSKVLEQDDEGRTVAREKAVIFNEKNERAVRMATALKNLDAAQLEGLMGASAAVTRYFASINTQYNPVFGIINLMRDVQGAIVNLNTTELKDDKLKVARGTMSALMGIMADARKARRGEAGTSEWSALWEDFQSVGGQTGYRQLFQTSADRAKDIQRALNPDAWMDSRWGRIFTAGGTLKVPLSVAMKGARWLFDLLSDYNLAMENGIRLSAYKVALDKGMSRERAASLAKNLTVNFNRKGQVGQQAGALYAFFNAAMQGTARLGQTLFEMEPGKPKTIRLSSLGKKIVYGGMLLGTTQALALAAAGFSDDDPPDFVRERSLIIPTGGKTYISIPMPLGLHVIPNIGRVTTEWALGGFKNTPQRVASLLGTFADSFNPIGNAGWSMQTLAPTALDPLVALTENKDWQGRPIAKESMNRDMPGPQLYRDTATSWGKLISESINYLSGGDKYSRGVLSPTPDQIDYLIGQLTGGVGREISKVEQTAVGLVRGEDVPTYKVPLVGRLIGDSGSQASEGTAFYANAQKLNKLETEIKLLREDGKTAEAQALRASRPEAYLMTQANYAERAIQRLRKEKSELIKDGAPREKIREIEERITARMAGLNRAMEALEAAR